MSSYYEHILCYVNKLNMIFIFIILLRSLGTIHDSIHHHLPAVASMLFAIIGALLLLGKYVYSFMHKIDSFALLSACGYWCKQHAIACAMVLSVNAWQNHWCTIGRSCAARQVRSAFVGRY